MFLPHLSRIPNFHVKRPKWFAALFEMVSRTCDVRHNGIYFSFHNSGFENKIALFPFPLLLALGLKFAFFPLILSFAG